MPRPAVWRSAAIVALALVLFAGTFRVGRVLGMAESLPRDSFTRAEMSIAVAISRLIYGAPGYVLYRPVVEALIDAGFRADTIAIPGRINAAIDHARRLSFAPDCTIPHMCADDWGDDKGYADFVMLAFVVFGLRIESLYDLYFLLLGISLILFASQFFREPGRLLLMLFFLAAHHVTVLILPDSTVTSVVHDARFLPALSTPAALHVALVAGRCARLRWWELALVGIQVLVMVLAIDGRASTKWQVVFIVAVAALAVLRSRERPGPATILRGPVVVVGIVAIGVGVLGAYQALAYDARYLREGIPSHVVWHNVYMGLGVHPRAVERFDLNPTDATAYRHAHRFLQARPGAARALGVDPARVPYPVFPAVGWRKYDEIVRAMYVQFWEDDWAYALATYLLYKPKYLLEQIGWQIGARSNFPRWVVVDDAVRPVQRTVYNPFRVLPITVVALGLVLTAGVVAEAVWRELLLMSLLFYLAALIPAFVVAPMYYELPVMFIALGLLLYVVGARLLGAVGSLVTSRGRS